MSYLVLARKWRPQRLEDLVGQEHVSRTLHNAIAAGRVHHAFLFTGARGVGKTSAARIFARALNCEQGPTPDPCGVCASCEAIAAGTDTDVFEIDGASNTGVDDIRELRDNIRYLPSRSRYKIFIIDEVHMLSINAFNALLKTLEEPPAHAKFIFATTEPQKIPITILSRCQRFDFRKIPLPRIAARLRQIADAEGIDISDRALQLVARNGGGSMRDALSTLDQVLAFSGDRVVDEEVETLLGAVDRRLLLETLEAVLQRDGRRSLDLLRRVDEQGYAWRHFCHELVDAFRVLLVLAVTDEPGGLLDLPDAEMAEFRRLAAGTSLEEVQRMLTLLIRTEAELASAGFPRLTLEMALLRLALLPRTLAVEELLAKLGQLEARLGGASLPAPQPPAAAPPATPAEPPLLVPPGEEPPPASAPAAAEPAAPPPAAGTDRWPELVEFINRKRRAVGSHLEHAHPLKHTATELVLGYPAGSFHLTYWEDRENLDGLQRLVEEFMGSAVRVSVRPVEAEAAPGPSLFQSRQEAQVGRRSQLEDEARSHPAVRTAMEVFGTDVADVKPLEPLAPDPDKA